MLEERIGMVEKGSEGIERAFPERREYCLGMIAQSVLYDSASRLNTEVLSFPIIVGALLSILEEKLRSKVVQVGSEHRVIAANGHLVIEYPAPDDRDPDSKIKLWLANCDHHVGEN